MTPKSHAALVTPSAPESSRGDGSVDVHLNDAERAASLVLEALTADGLSQEPDVTADGNQNDGGSAGRKLAEGLSTIAVHGGEARQKTANAITDPIFAASTYTFEDTQAVIDFIEQKQPREEYGRYGNPSERVVERKLASLEGGESALVFSSGMSALVVLLLAKLNAGDEVVFFDECYHRSREFGSKHLARFGV